MKAPIFNIISAAHIFLFLVSCSTDPQPIRFGEDECHQCKMRISNMHFGAESITKKGKVYKYDAIECLIRDIIERGEHQFNQVLVTDYHKPGKFISAQGATYLISNQLPSPMGAYLSAYTTKEDASQTKAKYDGNLFTWESIITKFKTD